MLWLKPIVRSRSDRGRRLRQKSAGPVAILSRILSTLALIAMLLSAPAWAASDVRAAQSFPGPASPGLARIYVYRDNGNYMHLAWARVWLNGALTGSAAPGSYFYRDVPPGNYAISVESDVPYSGDKTTISVGPNSTTFLRVYSLEGYGVTFNGGLPYIPNVFGVNAVKPSVAARQIANLTPSH